MEYDDLIASLGKTPKAAPVLYDDLMASLKANRPMTEAEFVEKQKRNDARSAWEATGTFTEHAFMAGKEFLSGAMDWALEESVPFAKALVRGDAEAKKAVKTSGKFGWSNTKTFLKDVKGALDDEMGGYDQPTEWKREYDRYLSSYKQMEYRDLYTKTSPYKKTIGIGQFIADPINLAPVGLVFGPAGKIIKGAVRKGVKGTALLASPAAKLAGIGALGVEKVVGFPRRGIQKVAEVVGLPKALSRLAPVATGGFGMGVLPTAAFGGVEAGAGLLAKTATGLSPVLKVLSTPSGQTRFLSRLAADQSVSPRMRSFAAWAEKYKGTQIGDLMFNMVADGVSAGAIMSAFNAAAGHHSAEELGQSFGMGVAMGGTLFAPFGTQGAGKTIAGLNRKGDMTARSKITVSNYLENKLSNEQRAIQKKMPPALQVAIATNDAVGMNGVSVVVLHPDEMMALANESIKAINENRVAEGKDPVDLLDVSPKGWADNQTRTIFLNEKKLGGSSKEALELFLHEIGHIEMFDFYRRDPAILEMMLDEYHDPKGETFHIYDEKGIPVRDVKLSKEMVDVWTDYNAIQKGINIGRDANALMGEVFADQYAMAFSKDANILKGLHPSLKSSIYHSMRRTLAGLGIMDAKTGNFLTNTISKTLRRNPVIIDFIKEYKRAKSNYRELRSELLEEGVLIDAEKTNQTADELFAERFGGVTMTNRESKQFVPKGKDAKKEMEESVIEAEREKADAEQKLNDAQIELAKASRDRKDAEDSSADNAVIGAKKVAEKLAKDKLDAIEKDARQKDFVGLGQDKEGRNISQRMRNLFTRGDDKGRVAQVIDFLQAAIDGRFSIGFGYRSGKKLDRYNKFHFRNVTLRGWQISPKTGANRSLKVVGWDNTKIVENINTMIEEGFIKGKDIEAYVREIEEASHRALKDSEGRINPLGGEKNLKENEVMTAILGMDVVAKGEAHNIFKNQRLADFFTEQNNLKDTKRRLRKAFVSFDVEALGGASQTGKKGMGFDYRNTKLNYMPDLPNGKQETIPLPFIDDIGGDKLGAGFRRAVTAKMTKSELAEYDRPRTAGELDYGTGNTSQVQPFQPRFPRGERQYMPAQKGVSEEIPKIVGAIDKATDIFNSVPRMGHQFERSWHVNTLVKRLLTTANPEMLNKLIQRAKDRNQTENQLRFEAELTKSDEFYHYLSFALQDLVASLPKIKSQDLTRGINSARNADPFKPIRGYFQGGQKRPLQDILNEMALLNDKYFPENYSNYNEIRGIGEILSKDYGLKIEKSFLDRLEGRYMDQFPKSERQYMPAEGVGLKDNIVDDVLPRITQVKLSPQQLQAALAKTAGAKSYADEIGLTEFVKGRKSITKDEVEAYVRENSPKLEVEVSKSEGQIHELGTKFRNYQEPGGTNYREVKVKLPQTGLRKIDTTGWTAEKTSSGVRPSGEPYARVRWNVYDKEGVLIDNEKLAKSSADAIRDAANLLAKEKSTPFSDPNHFGDNVLLWLRLNDRIDADGKRVLFIEELQSNWHQQGRKEGYQLSESEKNVLRKEFDELRKVYDEPGALDRMTEITDMLQGKGEFSKGVPDAPFKKNWPALAMKLAIKEAIEGGYDRVAWLDGEGQAARYDLSKQISKIDYSEGKRLFGGDLQSELRAYDHSGIEVIKQTGVTHEQLPGIIGKEAAEKMLAKKPEELPWGDGTAKHYTLEGIDLKVGGEGMKAFYDREMRSIASKISKKIGGGKVERETRLEAGLESQEFGSHGFDLPKDPTAVDNLRLYMPAGKAPSDARPPSLMKERQFMPAAYHGTPHTFKPEEGAPMGRFRSAQIGTGEGAQAYGHGLYFAGKKEVAEHYRKMGYDPEKQKVNGRQINDVYDSFYRKSNATSEDYQIAEGLERLMMHESPEDVVKHFKEGDYSKRAIKYFEDIDYETFGSLYKVELAPKENEYLLWDKPLSEQPKGVREKLEKVAKKFDIPFEDTTGGIFYADQLKVRRLDGDSAAASTTLLEAGIPGIKYLEGASRAEGKGDYNYVIFDEGAVTITEKMFMPAEIDPGTPVKGFNTKKGDTPNDMDYIRMGGKLTLMSPDEYINRVVDEFERKEGLTRKSVVDTRHGEATERVKKQLKKNEAPPLVLDTTKGWVSQEGMHRALAAKELGLKEVPVIFKKGDSTITEKMFMPAEEARMGELKSGEGAVLKSVPIPTKGNLASLAEIEKALSKDKKGRVGVKIKKNTLVGLRIDIPAYELTLRKSVSKDGEPTYVITIHYSWEGGKEGRAGRRIGYTNAAHILNPKFMVAEKGANKIRKGLLNKTTIATVEGKWVGSAIPKGMENWTQVGMNPKRHSYFYDRKTGEPVIGGSEGFSAGGTVFVKDAKFGDKSDFLFMPAKDNEYLTAVEKGDIATTGKLVEKAATGAGYNKGIMWRADMPIKEQREKSGFMRRDIKREDIRHPDIIDRDAIYLSPDRGLAEWFATSSGQQNFARPFFVKANKTAKYADREQVIYEKFEQPKPSISDLKKEGYKAEYQKTEAGDLVGNQLAFVHEAQGKGLKGWWRIARKGDDIGHAAGDVTHPQSSKKAWELKQAQAQKFATEQSFDDAGIHLSSRDEMSSLTKIEVDALKEAGFDSVEGHISGHLTGREFAVFDPANIKSADPVTYDAQGKPIPLSKRFDPSNPDIRFMPEGKAPLRGEVPSEIINKQTGNKFPSILIQRESEKGEVRLAKKSQNWSPEQWSHYKKQGALADEKQNSLSDSGANPEAYAEIMGIRLEGIKESEMPSFPSQIGEWVKNPKKLLDFVKRGIKTDPEFFHRAKDGIKSARQMHEIAKRGELSNEAVSLGFFWGFLSRMLDPYNQEAGWLRMVNHPQFLKQMWRSIDGKFDMERGTYWTGEKVVADGFFKTPFSRLSTKAKNKSISEAHRRNLAQKDKWVGMVSNILKFQDQRHALKAGKNATQNINASHSMFTKWNGKWDELTSIMNNPELTGPKMREQMWEKGFGGAGIQDKVTSFVIATLARGDVLVMDRWQYVNFWFKELAENVQKKRTELEANWKRHSRSLKSAKKNNNATAIQKAEKGMRDTRKELAEYREWGNSPLRFDRAGIPEDRTGFYKSVGSKVKDAASHALYRTLENYFDKLSRDISQIDPLMAEFNDAFSLHWLTWNMIKREAVGHSSLDVISEFSKVNKFPKNPKQRGKFIREFIEKEKYTERESPQGKVRTSVTGRRTLPRQTERFSAQYGRPKVSVSSR